jgi:hypothetical protein
MGERAKYRRFVCKPLFKNPGILWQTIPGITAKKVLAFRKDF